MKDKEIRARAKAFSGEGVREHKFLISGGEVTVWDPVAGHYTQCNILAESTKRRIRKLAEK